MVTGPTMKELEDISAELNLGLEGSTVLKEYQSVINDSLEMMNQLDDLVEPGLPVKYTRTPGYRPSREESPHNAWYYKCRITGADRGTLSGKRIAIKDSIAVAGIPMKIGFSGLEGYVPDFDATVVTWVLDEGGIILGKATCEELCNSANSHTSGTGPVTNPLNPRHCAGGSSSGCAVLVATNEVDMAIGSDQGGSVRIPASWCGLVGLKPTFGLIPFTGAVSREFVVDHLGPIARTVKDCALLLEVIAGYDNGNDARQRNDLKTPYYSQQVNNLLNVAKHSSNAAIYNMHFCQNALDHHLEELDPKSIRMAVLKEGFGSPGSNPEVDRLVLETIDMFASSSGAHVQEVSIPLRKSSIAIGTVIGDIGGIDMIYTTAGE
ncbi:uncharacterized protein LOC105443268 [Strongylocentrotus purpuratus]|uniref:Amidase domain-containing protein n=1 Tax=Strongylocentrotus purpuratus TaxID=7668 RepID=A0A7M7N0R3_STRPU|nr:uncharacterized protein LOC105443268 [Strongylocentrotus purpuratus]